MLKDPVSRSKYILNGKLTFSKNILFSELTGLLDELASDEVYYVTIELRDQNRYYHLILVGNTLAACYGEHNDLLGEDCLSELKNIGSNTRLRVNVYRIPLEILSEAEKEIIAKYHPGEEIPRIEEPSIESEKSGISGSVVVEESVAKPIELVEYELLSEISKYGYLIEEATITPGVKDVMVFLKLKPIEKPSSLKELLYISAKHVCLNMNPPEKLGVVVEFNGSKKTLILDLGGDQNKCLGLGIVPEILRNNGLQLIDLKIKERNDLFEISIKAKQLSQELNVSPDKAVVNIRDSIRSILGKNVKVKLSTGLFGGKYEA